MKYLQEDLDDLSNKVYIFSINTLSFVKSLEKSDTKPENAVILLTLAGKLTDILLDTADKTDRSEIIKDLGEAHKIIEKYFESGINFMRGI